MSALRQPVAATADASSTVRESCSQAMPIVMLAGCGRSLDGYRVSGDHRRLDRPRSAVGSIG